MLRLLGILLTVAAAVAAAVVTWPQFFRLERTFPFAQLVAARPALVIGFAVVAVLAVLLMLVRPARGFAASVLVVAVVASAANAAILTVRGLGSDDMPAPTADSIRVMTWNTAGEATDPALIARTAIAMQADIVALPETTADTGTEVAVAMREGGSPMWVHHEDFEGWDANWTTLLISPDLGDYAVVDSVAGGTSNTSIVPSVVAMPVSGEGPIVVAAHAVAPREDEMSLWRRDLQWLADQCASENVIMAGDFNATVDHMARLGVHGGDLGRCRDAAVHTGNGGVGTWDTRWPALLGVPIDHIMATAAWTPTGSVVLNSLDGQGSDHRPVIVQYEPAG